MTNEKADKDKYIPALNYLFKVNKRNGMSLCEICLKLTIKIPERHQWRRSGVFIVNLEQIRHIATLSFNK